MKINFAIDPGFDADGHKRKQYIEWELEPDRELPKRGDLITIDGVTHPDGSLRGVWVHNVSEANPENSRGFHHIIDVHYLSPDELAQQMAQSDGPGRLLAAFKTTLWMGMPPVGFCFHLTGDATPPAPAVFQTIVFAGTQPIDERNYYTEADALAGHQQMVTLARWYDGVDVAAIAKESPWPPPA